MEDSELDLYGSEYEQEMGCWECGNKPCVFIKCGEFIYLNRKY